MIAGIIIYLLVGFIYISNSFRNEIKNNLPKEHILNFYAISCIIYPIAIIEDFYYWNFIDCEQYGIKK